MNGTESKDNSNNSPSPSSKSDWKIRRRIIFLTLAFCLFEVIYLTVFAESTELNETLANGTLILAGSVIGSYVFGAVWDDNNVGNRR